MELIKIVMENEYQQQGAKDKTTFLIPVKDIEFVQMTEAEQQKRDSGGAIIVGNKEEVFYIIIRFKSGAQENLQYKDAAQANSHFDEIQDKLEEYTGDGESWK